MTTIELEQVIRDYIQDIYKKCYIGKIIILKLNPAGYHIQLGMDTPNQPLVICAELEDDLFLKFLREELKIKKFNLRSFGKLNLVYQNNSCSKSNTETCETHVKHTISRPVKPIIPNNDDNKILLEDGNYLLLE